MSKKEEKAKEYALSIAETDKQWGAPLNKEQTSIIMSAFESGWDEALKQSYIDAINQHIELLERKKRMIENQFIGNGSSSLVSGIIHGLNFAIEQLYHDINHLKG